MSLSYQVTFVILCIAAIFITGIPLGKYLSNQYFQLRRELNSHGSKYSSHENVYPASGKLKLQNENQNTTVTRENRVETEIELHSTSIDTVASSLQTPMKVKKRSKRRAPYSNKDHLFWSVNLNVTRLQENKNSTDIQYQNRRLEVAVAAKGEAEMETSVNELMNAVQGIQIFIKGVFHNKTENMNITHQEVKINPVHIEEETLIKKFDGVTQDIDTVKLKTEENQKPTLNQKGRQSKFLLELLGFGGNRPETKLPEDITVSPENDFISDNSQEVIDLHTESFVSENKIPSKVLEGVDSILQLNLEGTTEQNECSDCVTKENELSDSTNKMKETTNRIIPETVHTTESVFTDEVLEQFCMSLVNKLEESQQSDEEGNDFELNTRNETNQLRSPKSRIMDLIALFNSLKEETNPESTIIDDSFLVGDESRLQTSGDRQSKFLNFPSFLGFGSGRSSIVEESNDLFLSNPSKDKDIETLPSISDCENYFRKKQSTKMFPKPNLVDMINDPKIQLSDFANATISPKLNEQHLQFLTGLLTSLNNSVETFDSNLEDTTEKHEFDKDGISHAEDFSINEHIVIEGKEIDHTASDNWNKLTDTITKNDQEFDQVTEMQRNGRFFDPGSGSDENQRPADSRLFGSGERSLETTNTSTKYDQFEEFSDDLLEEFGTTFVQEDRILGLFGIGGSGNGRELNESIEVPSVSEDLLEGFGTTHVQESRLLGLFGVGGSGNGRELSESVEVVPKEVTPFTNGCNDCNFESFHNTNAEFTEDTGKTESECVDCSPSKIAHDDSRNEVVESAHENCNCIKKNSDRNTSFSDCDECGSIFLESANYSLEITESDQSKVVTSEYMNIKSAEVVRNDCDDCDDENGLHSTNTTNSYNEMSNAECSDCDVGSDLHSTNTTNSYNEMSDVECSDCDVGSDLHSTNTTNSYNEMSDAECSDCDIGSDLQNTNTTNSDSEIILSECNNCDYGSDLHSTNTTNSYSEMPVSECDDCNYVIGMPEGSSETENRQSEDGNQTLTQNIENDCLECNYENQTQETTAIENLKFAITHAVTDTEFITKPVTSPEDTSIHFMADVENNSVTDPPDQHSRHTTEVFPRIVGGIFLDGSGDESLFGNNGETTNLVEESTILPVLFRRGGDKLDDNVEDESSITTPIVFRRGGRRLDDNFEDENSIITPVEFPQRRGRLEEIEPCDDCNVDLNEMFEQKSNESEKMQIERHGLGTIPSLGIVNVSETEATFSSEIFPNIPSISADVSKPNKPQSRPCTSASECNSTLNERCITINSSPVCRCGRAYVRHKETNKCVVKRVVETSLRFPAEKFEKDLENPLSPRYKQMRENALDTMWLLLLNKPELRSIIAEVDISKFQEGSLIVSWNLVFAVETESEAKLIKEVDLDLQKALKAEKVIQKTSLDVNNASVLAFVSESNPCHSSELNYCSDNAYCVWNEALIGRFTCYCKDHYRDASSNPLYRGETCTADCPPEYCGTNGHCEISENEEKFCMCSGMYFGRRCDVPGMYVVGFLVLVALLSLVFVLVIGYKTTTRCKRGYGGSEETGTHSRDRVTDIIALEENAVSNATKYANISTPTIPMITITQPSIHESSISFDGDSTFNVTPNATMSSTEQKTTI